MMRLFRFILLLPLLLFSCYSSILGQSTWFFKQLAVRDGLSHNQINHIFRDSNGFMWFSTASGLNRYDGYKFKVFFHNPNDEYSLPDNLISSVQEDANRRLWIQTGNGYTVFNPEKKNSNKALFCCRRWVSAVRPISSSSTKTKIYGVMLLHPDYTCIMQVTANRCSSPKTSNRAI